MATMFTLDLKSGGSVAIATVAEGTTLQSLISSQVTASGREVGGMYTSLYMYMAMWTCCYVYV